MANDHWRERSEVGNTYIHTYMSIGTVKDAENLRPRDLYVYRDLLIYVAGYLAAKAFVSYMTLIDLMYRVIHLYSIAENGLVLCQGLPDQEQAA